MRSQIERKINQLDQKVCQKVDELDRKVEEKVLRNMAAFEERIMSKIEHVHAVAMCLISPSRCLQSAAIMLFAEHIVSYVENCGP